MMRVLAMTLLIAACAPSETDGGPNCRSSGETYVLQGSGTEFAAYEGLSIVAVTSTEAMGSVCSSAVQTRVVGGAFSFEIENPWDGFSVYPRYGAFVDLDGDERCDDDEPVWTSVGILIREVSTGQLRGSDEMGSCEWL